MKKIGGLELLRGKYIVAVKGGVEKYTNHVEK